MVQDWTRHLFFKCIFAGKINNIIETNNEENPFTDSDVRPIDVRRLVQQ